MTIRKKHASDSKVSTKREHTTPRPDVSVDIKVSATLEQFAAAFFAGIERGDIDDALTPEGLGDPRVALVVTSLRKLGIAGPVRVLGNGSFGVAALDEDGHVLKLTSDQSETQAGAVLKGKNLPHVVWIAGAWYIKDALIVNPYTEKRYPVGILSMQRVSPLESGPERTAFSRVVNNVKEQEKGYLGHFEDMPPRERRAHLLHVSIEMEKTLRRHGDQLYQDVANALRELRNANVYAIDVHGGNVGWDPESNAYRVYDIGTSSSPGRPKPPIVGEGASATPV